MGLRRKIQSVYCQVCGRDLTDTGGMVDGGALVCRSTIGPKTDCSEIYSIQSGGGLFIWEYQDPQEVQKEIRKEYLVKFGSLEKSVSKVNG